MYYFYAKRAGIKKKYYFNVAGEFNTIEKNLRLFRKISTGKKVISALGELPKGWKLHHVKHGIKKVAKKTYPLIKIKRAKKNPVNEIINRKIQKAIENFKEFSGHTPEYINKKDLPKMEVGFKIGTLDGLLYTTVRDGRTEKYVHKFSRRARPILVSNFDGSFIALIGGNYKFTDRGIVDN